MLLKEKLNEFTEAICKEVKMAQENKAQQKLIFEDKTDDNHKNEYILFIKPEITLKNQSIKLQEIVKLIFNKISEFGLTINLIKILPGKYLDQYNIMAQHYGVINKLSNNACREISEAGKAKFKEIYGLSIEDADVYGGHEFLKKSLEFTPYTLDVLWQNSNFGKLASGTYCGKFSYDAHNYFLINGFHPSQLMHFNGPGRSVVVFSLTGNINWTDARNNFIGLTDPSKANKGSIRHELLLQKEKLGIPILNTAFNGVHLSAGPVEALNELIRFNSDYSDTNKIKKIDNFRIGRLLKENFTQDQINRILDNAKTEHNGQVVSSFDLTEEKNTDDMVEILKPCYG